MRRKDCPRETSPCPREVAWPRGWQTSLGIWDLLQAKLLAPVWSWSSSLSLSHCFGEVSLTGRQPAAGPAGEPPSAKRALVLMDLRFTAGEMSTLPCLAVQSSTLRSTAPPSRGKAAKGWSRTGGMQEVTSLIT